MADPQDWRERVVGALGAVVMVALVIGVVIGAVAYGAIRFVGLDGGDDSAQTPASAPDSPAASGTHAAEPTASPSRASSSAGPPKAHRQQGDTGPKHHGRRHRGRHGLTLEASPLRVHRMGRVHLWGRYPGHGGARLVVQRREGGHWDRFPVAVSVRDGRFRTWIASGYPGRNRFRVLDPATGLASAPVSFTVH